MILRKYINLSLVLLVMMSISAKVFSAPDLDVVEFWDARNEQSQEKIDHGAWQELLNTYLDDEHVSGINRFDYKSVTSADSTKLDTYLDYLQSRKPRELNSDEQFAYWVNLYNAKTVDFIIDGVQEDQIKSIKDIRSLIVVPGPWKRKALEIEGQKVSLDIIEHGILRPIWQDHRIHFAVNCASIGCPNLLKTAYTAENTEGLLEIAEEQFLQHPRAVSDQAGTLVFTSLFDWYGADFAETQNEMFDYLSDFVSPELVELMNDEPKVTYDYDWNLNAP